MVWYRNTCLLVLTAFSGIAGFLFGYDTGNISGALPYIKDELLTAYESSPRRSGLSMADPLDVPSPPTHLRIAGQVMLSCCALKMFLLLFKAGKGRGEEQQQMQGRFHSVVIHTLW